MATCRHITTVANVEFGDQDIPRSQHFSQVKTPWMPRLGWWVAGGSLVAGAGSGRPDAQDLVRLCYTTIAEAGGNFLPEAWSTPETALMVKVVSLDWL